ncbi:hypothetical protein E2320_016870, partial [Naja naja]
VWQPGQGLTGGSPYQGHTWKTVNRHMLIVVSHRFLGPSPSPWFMGIGLMEFVDPLSSPHVCHPVASVEGDPFHHTSITSRAIERPSVRPWLQTWGEQGEGRNSCRNSMGLVDGGLPGWMVPWFLTLCYRQTGA